MQPRIIHATILDMSYHGLMLELPEHINVQRVLQLEFELALVDYRAVGVYARVIKIKQERGRIKRGPGKGRMRTLRRYDQYKDPKQAEYIKKMLEPRPTDFSVGSIQPATVTALPDVEYSLPTVPPELLRDDTPFASELVTRHAARAPLQRLKRIAVGAVVHAQHHGGSRLGPHAGRMGAPLERLLHPGHVAVQALGDEGLQPLSGRPRIGGRGEADDVEPQARGARADRGLGVGERHGCWSRAIRR